jgi:hypothetical protein
MATLTVEAHCRSMKIWMRIATHCKQPISNTLATHYSLQVNEALDEDSLELLREGLKLINDYSLVDEVLI